MDAFNSTNLTIPAFFDENNVIFTCYDASSTVYKGNLVNPIFQNMNPSWNITFVVHGYLQNASNYPIIQLKDAILAVELNTYVCTVDWQVYSLQPYSNSVNDVPKVGKTISDFSVSLGRSPSVKINCYGYSLGAHVCGFAGKNYKNLNIILGIDPAGPLYDGKNSSYRLNSGDASYVVHLKFTDCVSTSEKCGDLLITVSSTCPFLGIYCPYSNNFLAVPGTIVLPCDLCLHFKAPLATAALIRNPNKFKYDNSINNALNQPQRCPRCINLSDTNVLGNCTTTSTINSPYFYNC